MNDSLQMDESWKKWVKIKNKHGCRNQKLREMYWKKEYGVDL